MATLDIFSSPEGMKKCLLGSLPKPGDFGTKCPKVLSAALQELPLLFLMFPATRGPDQMVDVGLDCHGLPHIPLGRPIF